MMEEKTDKPKTLDEILAAADQRIMESFQHGQMCCHDHHLREIAGLRLALTCLLHAVMVIRDDTKEKDGKQD